MTSYLHYSGRFVWASVAVASIFAHALTPTEAEAQHSVLNRLVCPVSMPGAGCMRLQVNLGPAQNGERLLSVVMQNLQVAQYPGDPWISSVWSVSMSGQFATTPPAWGYQRPAWVGYYGALQNSIGSTAAQWDHYHDHSSAVKKSIGFTMPLNVTPVQAGLGGCTNGSLPSGGLPNGLPLGYRSCQQTSFGSLVLMGKIPDAIAWSSVQELRVIGFGFDGVSLGSRSWQCDAMVLGRSNGPGMIPATQCDVSDATDRLDIGALTYVVTPEPATVGLVGLGLVALAGLRTRRRSQAAKVVPGAPHARDA